MSRLLKADGTPARNSLRRVYVWCHNKAIFADFKKQHMGAALQLICVTHGETFKIEDGDDVIVIGPFWMMRKFESAVIELRKRTATKPTISLRWFPM